MSAVHELAPRAASRADALAHQRIATAVMIAFFALGLIEGLTKVFYPEASNTVIFITMAIVLMIKPAGLFGTQK